MSEIREEELNMVSGGIGEENYDPGWYVIYRPTGVSCAGPFDKYEEAVKVRDEILVKWPEAKGLLDIDTPPYP